MSWAKIHDFATIGLYQGRRYQPWRVAIVTRIRNAWRDQSGAVSTDWAVLTGAMVAMTLIMMATMNGESSSVADEIETVLTDVEVAQIGDVGFAP